MLVKLSISDQKVKEHNQVARENKKEFPNLGFNEVEALEDIFLPYAKLLDSDYLDGYTKIQEDYRDKEEFRGIYVCSQDSNHLIAKITNYKEVANLKSPVYCLDCGVADNASQVLDYYEELCKKYHDYTKDKDFVILMSEIFREEEPEEQGWLWREGGEYIGKFEPKCEYFHDEEGIDFVWLFHIVEVERQEAKLDILVQEQEQMKTVNAYYRKHKTLEGCPSLTSEEVENIQLEMQSSWHYGDKPYLSWQLNNNNQNIHKTKERLDSLKAEKEKETSEYETKHFKAVENTEIMRLQLFFDGKPKAEIREVIKHYGFKWSPKNQCWQRQLTNNARYSLQCLVKKLDNIKEVTVK